MKHLSGIVKRWLLLTVGYLLLTQLLPANKADLHTYNLSLGQYHVLRFLLALPLSLLWFAALFGYSQLNQYAKAIAKTPEAEGYRRLSVGCYWLAWSLIVPTVISLVFTTIYASHPGFHSAAVIIINYLSLGLTLLAFSSISSGTQELAAKTKQRFSAANMRSLQFIFVAGGVLYCYLTFRNLDLHSLASTNNPYYLPIWLLISSFFIPNLYAWFIGLLAAYEIGSLAERSAGVLYQRALKVFAIGLAVVIACLISVQYLHTIVPRTGHLSLNTILIFTYSIYMAAIIGFALLALGAWRLKRIEEV